MTAGFAAGLPLAAGSNSGTNLTGLPLAPTTTHGTPESVIPAEAGIQMSGVNEIPLSPVEVLRTHGVESRRMTIISPLETPSGRSGLLAANSPGLQLMGAETAPLQSAREYSLFEKIPAAALSILIFIMAMAVTGCQNDDNQDVNQLLDAIHEADPTLDGLANAVIPNQTPPPRELTINVSAFYGQSYELFLRTLEHENRDLYRAWQEDVGQLVEDFRGDANTDGNANLISQSELEARYTELVEGEVTRRVRIQGAIQGLQTARMVLEAFNDRAANYTDESESITEQLGIDPNDISAIAIALLVICLLTGVLAIRSRRRFTNDKNTNDRLNQELEAAKQELETVQNLLNEIQKIPGDPNTKIPIEKLIPTIQELKKWAERKVESVLGIRENGIIADLETANAELEARNQAARARVEEEKRRLEEQERQIQEEIEHLAQVEEGKEREITRLQERLEEVRGRVLELDGEQVTIIGIKSQVSALEDELDELNVRLKRLESKRPKASKSPSAPPPEEESDEPTKPDAPRPDAPTRPDTQSTKPEIPKDLELNVTDGIASLSAGPNMGEFAMTEQAGVAVDFDEDRNLYMIMVDEVDVSETLEAGKLAEEAATNTLKIAKETGDPVASIKRLNEGIRIFNKDNSQSASTVAITAKIRRPEETAEPQDPLAGKDPHHAESSWVGNNQGMVLRKPTKGWERIYSTVPDSNSREMLTSGALQYEKGGKGKRLAMQTVPFVDQPTVKLGEKDEVEVKGTSDGEVPNKSDTGDRQASEYGDGVPLKRGDLAIFCDGRFRPSVLCELISDLRQVSAREVVRVIEDEAKWRSSILSEAREHVSLDERYPFDHYQGHKLFIDDSGKVFENKEDGEPIDHYSEGPFKIMVYFNNPGAPAQEETVAKSYTAKTKPGAPEGNETVAVKPEKDVKTVRQPSPADTDASGTDDETARINGQGSEGRRPSQFETGQTVLAKLPNGRDADDNDTTTKMEHVPNILTVRDDNHLGLKIPEWAETITFKRRIEGKGPQVRLSAGKSEKNIEVLLADDTVSRKDHARILLTAEGTHLVEDLGSSHGITVKDTSEPKENPLNKGQRRPLSIGTEITIGNIRIVVENLPN
jgi:hypothetical protein